jgi:hypothetical protein
MDYKLILEQLEEALKEADTLEQVFDESKESINKLENIRLQAKEQGMEFSDESYEESKKKFDEGKYGSAVQISNKDSVNLDTCYSTFVEMKKTFLETDGVGIQNKKGLEEIQNEMNKMMLAEKFSEANELGLKTDKSLVNKISDYNSGETLVSEFNNLIKDAKKHILIEAFVPKQEKAEQNLEKRNLSGTITEANSGIEEVKNALKSWIPKIKISLPEDLVATESNRAAILVENIGKVKIGSVTLEIEGLDVSGRLSTGEIKPGDSEEIVVGLIPSTPGNIPVTITSKIIRTYDDRETSIDEQIWVEILRPGFSTPTAAKRKSKPKDKAVEDVEIVAEWKAPSDLSDNESIIGDFFNKRWESYQAYPENEVILDHLHNNREKYAISSYFEIPTESKSVMEDWALPHNLRGNIHLDAKRKEIVRDIFESPFDENYVIIGEPGVGKTVLLFEVFDKLMKREPAGILTNENIGDAHEKFKIRLFYDDISEKPDLYNAVASKESIGGLILSSREAEWSELPVDFRKKFTRLTVPLFSDEEMEQLILKTLDVNVILHDPKALKTLISYSQGSPIYVGSLIKEMAYNGIRRLSETYLKENAQKGMSGYVIMILQRLLKVGNDYRAGGLHTLSCLMFLANHVEERKCHEQLLRAFADEIDAPMEEKFDDIYDRRTFNRSIDYLSGEGSLVRFPHDTWVDILQGQGASNPFRSDIQEIRKEFEDTGMFEQLKKDAIDDAWEAIQKRYKRNNVREKDSFLELCNTLTSNFRLSDLKEMGVDIDMVREIASKHRDEPVAAAILSRLESAEPTHNVINIQDSVISRSDIGS